ncbi:MAG: hypothetical protein R3E47_02330 [Paracoccaceae bacterium]
MNRRNLLAAAPAAAMAACASGALAASAAVSETPVMRIFREWEAMSAYLDGEAARSMSEDEYDTLVDDRHEIEKTMMATPAQNARDVLLKLSAWTDFGALGIGSDETGVGLFWQEVRDLIG